MLSDPFSGPLHSQRYHVKNGILHSLRWKRHPLATMNISLTTEIICVEEIENALKTLKLGKSGGLDSLSPEHIVYGV